MIMIIYILNQTRKGGGATKRASSFIYIIPSTSTGEIFGFINFEQLNPIGIMAKTDLTNQNIAEIVPRALNIENS